MLFLKLLEKTPNEKNSVVQKKIVFFSCIYFVDIVYNPFSNTRLLAGDGENEKNRTQNESDKRRRVMPVAKKPVKKAAAKAVVKKAPAKKVAAKKAPVKACACVAKPAAKKAPAKKAVAKKK